MVAHTCFGITLPSSGSVSSAFWEMLNWGAVNWILWMEVLCLMTWCVFILFLITMFLSIEERVFICAQRLSERTVFTIVPNSILGPDHGCSKCGISQYLQAKSDVVPYFTAWLLPTTVLCNVLFTDDIKTTWRNEIVRAAESVDVQNKVR
jgi:hypothetical protein